MANRRRSRRGNGDHVGLGAWAGEAFAGVGAGPVRPVSSLPSLSPAATLVDSIWGMGSVAVAGYDGNNSAYATEYVLAMPQTLLAAGNDPLSLPAFTSEIIAGAGGVFGRINVANMAPVTQSSNIVGLGFKDVAAGTNAPDTGSKGPDPSTNPLTNVVKPSSGGCFAAGTLIPMADGSLKPIERIEEADDVHGVDQNDPEGPVSVGKVAEIYRHEPQPLMEVELGGGVIRCTGNHPFYVRGRGFIPAEQLKCGDELRTASGGWSSVGVITASGLEEPVYNIRVAGLHTYFVRAGASEALVHNKGGNPDGDGTAATQSPPFGSYPSPPFIQTFGDDGVIAPQGGTNTRFYGADGTSKSIPYTGTSLAPVTPLPNPVPVTAKNQANETPQERLKQAFNRLFKNQVNNLKWNGYLDFQRGYSAGMWQGIKSTGSLIADVLGRRLPGRHVARGENNWDWIVSWRNNGQAVVYREPIDALCEQAAQGSPQRTEAAGGLQLPEAKPGRLQCRAGFLGAPPRHVGVFRRS